MLKTNGQKLLMRLIAKLFLTSLTPQIRLTGLRHF
jgi:hypothetical protein